ncbi:MAG: hypothetical protein DRQ64_08340 [Gammaproteobacteria bacterium]|nr:MAG: hypothetical protein DRQ64_08340 [Gammaproteobacteria bacterium]
MSGPERLKSFEDNWQTEMGAWFPGERVVLRGKDVFTELNNHSWMEYMLFAITGKENTQLARLIEGIWLISSSFPDPRLWNNRVAALAGTARSTGLLAVTAGLAVSEATTYGLQPIYGAIDFLNRAKNSLENNESIESVVKAELKKYRNIYGYGRPITSKDERVEPLLQFAKSLGIDNGPFLDLALEIGEYLSNSKYKFKINIAGIDAGIAADQGLTSREFYYLATLSFVAGMFPCYIDSVNKPEGSFFPLAVDRIKVKEPMATRVWRTE